jgi:hypothetical protein
MKALSGPKLRPHWDADLRQLCFGRKVVREFEREATSQIPLFDALEAAGWPQRLNVRRLVPDGENAKEWLKRTVRNINRGLRFIRFRGSGTALVVAWGVDSKKKT